MKLQKHANEQPQNFTVAFSAFISLWDILHALEAKEAISRRTHSSAKLTHSYPHPPSLGEVGFCYLTETFHYHLKYIKK